MSECTPEWAAGITGIPAATIRRLAYEMGVTARDHRIELPIAWTDSLGRRARNRHRKSGGVSCDARARRALERLPYDSRAGDPDVDPRDDRPARRVPAQDAVPARDSAEREAPNSPTRSSRTRRWPPSRSAGRRRPTIFSSTRTAAPCASTRRFSWEYPLAVHGMMHNVITNAWRGDPYRIDTLMIFMANMAWNSTHEHSRRSARC